MYWGAFPFAGSLPSLCDPLWTDHRATTAGGTVTPSGSLVPAPFPTFMDSAWPHVLDRIAETGVYDGWTGNKGKGKERGPNHVSHFFWAGERARGSRGRAKYASPNASVYFLPARHRTAELTSMQFLSTDFWFPQCLVNE